MRVIVAGATGAIGSRLVPQLVAAGHDVVAMTRSPAKADALKVAILHYVDHPERRRRVGAAARQRILREFGRERMVEGTLSVYAEVLKPLKYGRA